MAVLRWQSAMQLGIPAIDADHKRLVALLNGLHYAVLAGEDHEGVGGTIEELVRYTEGHFAREEALMERSGYPGRYQHSLAHARIAERMREWHADYARAPAAFPMDRFYDFVSGWLLHHVLEEDMKLKPYVTRLTASTYAYA